jgi:hypothetical protein
LRQAKLRGSARVELATSDTVLLPHGALAAGLREGGVARGAVVTGGLIRGGRGWKGRPAAVARCGRRRSAAGTQPAGGGGLTGGPGTRRESLG